jgi:hypothetical protein
LVFVTGLTVGDYLLWNWSLAGNHVALALLAGFTLVPLAVVCALLLALTVLRALARSSRRPAGHRRSARDGRSRRRRRVRVARTESEPSGEVLASTTRTASSPRKLAA